MAKKASPAKSGATARKRTAKPKAKTAARKPARAKAASRPKRASSPRRRSSEVTAADALFKLIQSPLVADLLAVGATAALAAVAESRSRRKDDAGRKSSRALKDAAKAAAAAMGRRLSTEVGEIRKASAKTRTSAKT